MDTKTVLQGGAARDLLSELLELPRTITPNTGERIAGYFKNLDSTWTAFDNTSGNCWVEDFVKETAAKRYATKDFVCAACVILAACNWGDKIDDSICSLRD